jgi:hypothetical protein
MERRTTRLGSNKSAFRTLHRSDFFVPGTGSSGTGANRSSPSRQAFAHPSPAPPSHLRQTLDSGDGRLPKAPRVHACEAQPRAPHPTGLGYPAPIKLSLCPTSVTPLEAPLIGQDTIRISEVPGTGIRNPKKFFNQRFQDHAPRTQCCAALADHHEESAPRPGHGRLAYLEHDLAKMDGYADQARV